ncbi:MAG TPA: cyclic 2,3-diphosphoglycerate synthase [bacterium]|nr:cyclic 2,3-diphosphoglycerate synthase [bacterium]
MQKRRVLIMGAAGRDFHNFNLFYRGNENYEVVAFTATQIPDIAGRAYPTELAGPLYPDGIPIHDESDLPRLIEELKVDDVVFAYSDVPHEYVMHKCSLVNAAGANFILMGARETMVKSKKPLVSICAVRTGCGKSQTTRRVADILIEAGKKVVAIRHPMPYGDLREQVWQRFGEYDDMIKHKCTIEEMEEYEPHIDKGIVVFAGVDYGRILEEAEKEADVVLWDGGNNDASFYAPDLLIVVADPHRVGHELGYYPGEQNLRAADVVVINKEDSAEAADVDRLVENVKSVNPSATIVHADSPVVFDEEVDLKGKRVLVVEDGPTLTHGGMKIGAGTVAALAAGAELVDPREHAVGKMAETYKKYPNIGVLLPAMGYSPEQVADLQTTINAVDCDYVVIGTPIDLRKVVDIEKPSVRVRYDLKVTSSPNLKDVLGDFL